MKTLPEKLKNKSVGYYVLLGAAVLGLITSIMYLAFGLASHTFSGGIFACALISFLCIVVLVFYDGYFADFVPLAAIVIMSLALVLLVGDSIDDITAFVVGMGNYFGNADNVGMRVTVAIFMLLTIIASIVGSFMRRTKETVSQ